MRDGSAGAWALIACLVASCAPAKPGLHLRLELPVRALPSLARVEITLRNATGASLGMEAEPTLQRGVQVRTQGSTVRFTIAQDQFALKQSFELLLQPTGTEPLRVHLGGQMFHASGQLLGTAPEVKEVDVVPGRRTGPVSLIFACADVVNCAPVVTTQIDPGSPPPSPQVVAIVGEAQGDRLEPAAVGRFFRAAESDLVLASSRKDPGGHPGAGVVYVLRARDWSVPGFSSSFRAGDADLVIVGRDGDGLGAAAAAGDIDGDGLDDLLVSGPGAIRPNAPAGTSYAGAGVAYFFTAKRMAGASRLDLNDPAVFAATPRIFGATGQERLGSAIALGHVRDATTTDLLLGAPGGRGGRGGDKAGRVYVVAGFDPAAAPSLEILLGEPGAGPQLATLLGPEANAQFGLSIAAGDVDDDRQAELCVGNFVEQGRGSVSCLRGGRLSTGSVFDLAADGAAPGAYDLRLLGPDHSQLGWAILFADLLQLGRPQLVIGARGSSTVYAVELDGFGAGAVRDLSAGGYRALITGPSGSFFGSALSAGNLDGDAAVDLLVGAPGQGSAELAGAGGAYAFRGADLKAGGTLPAASTTALLLASGRKGEALGGRVALASWNVSPSSPFDELIVGASGAGMSLEGATYVVEKLP